MQRTLLPVLALASLAACSSPEGVNDDLAIDPDAASVEERLAKRAGAGSEALDFTDEETRGEAAREFTYAWPAQVSAIPELAATLGRMRDRALSEQKAEWESALEEFEGEDCVSCTNRGYGTTWEVVADTGRFLSLSASTYVYSGGAHGNGYFDALVWDREVGDALETRAFFTSPQELEAAIRPAWCAALDSARQERRGEEYVAQGGLFDDCPPLSDLTLLLGSSNGETFDRLGLLAAPYVAGPYAEGSYEVTIPVTAEVLQVVKPAYRAVFAGG